MVARDVGLLPTAWCVVEGTGQGELVVTKVRRPRPSGRGPHLVAGRPRPISSSGQVTLPRDLLATEQLRTGGYVYFALDREAGAVRVLPAAAGQVR